MRYSLRTLLVVMLLGGPLLAWAWCGVVAWWEWRVQLAAARSAPVQTVPWQGLTVTNQPPIEVEIERGGTRVTTRSLHELGALPEQQISADPWQKLLELPEDAIPQLELPPAS